MKKRQMLYKKLTEQHIQFTENYASHIFDWSRLIVIYIPVTVLLPNIVVISSGMSGESELSRQTSGVNIMVHTRIS